MSTLQNKPIYNVTKAICDNSLSKSHCQILKYTNGEAITDRYRILWTGEIEKQTKSTIRLVDYKDLNEEDQKLYVSEVGYLQDCENSSKFDLLSVIPTNFSLDLDFNIYPYTFEKFEKLFKLDILDYHNRANLIFNLEKKILFISLQSISPNIENIQLTLEINNINKNENNLKDFHYSINFSYLIDFLKGLEFKKVPFRGEEPFAWFVWQFNDEFKPSTLIAPFYKYLLTPLKKNN